MPETQTDPLPPALRDGLNDYLLALRVEAGLSRSTLAAYESDLSLFLTWLAGRGVKTYDALETDMIVDWASKLLTDPSAYEEMSVAHNPYGDGKATTRILDALAKFGAAR